MKCPLLRFIVSKKRDCQTAEAFIKEAKYDNGRNLEWAIFKKYPNLRKYCTKPYNAFNRKKFFNFVSQEYAKRHAVMAKDLAVNRSLWKKKEKGFYDLTAKIFSNKKWPKGRYIAYGTIWGMYPRFLNTKTFQIPYRHKKPMYIPVIVAHEMLHFMFYDYLYKRYPVFTDQEKYSFFNWHVSEIFNTIIQNSKEWARFFGCKTMSYPEHNKTTASIIEHLGKKYLDNLDVLTDTIIKFVKKDLG